MSQYFTTFAYAAYKNIILSNKWGQFKITLGTFNPFSILLFFVHILQSDQPYPVGLLLFQLAHTVRKSSLCKEIIQPLVESAHRVGIFPHQLIFAGAHRLVSEFAGPHEHLCAVEGWRHHVDLGMLFCFGISAPPLSRRRNKRCILSRNSRKSRHIRSNTRPCSRSGAAPPPCRRPPLSIPR